MKQGITIVNAVRGTSKTLLLDRETCRLSIRQARETFQNLSVPGFEKGGVLGEWPLVQEPPECEEVPYRVVRAGEQEGSLSNLYFVPVDAAKGLIERLGAPT